MRYPYLRMSKNKCSARLLSLSPKYILCCREASQHLQATMQHLHYRLLLTIIDKARQALARGVPLSIRRSYRALADHGGVPHTTLHHRAHGRPSLKDKADSQLYLTP
jgi:hypothetical protein